MRDLGCQGAGRLAPARSERGMPRPVTAPQRKTVPPVKAGWDRPCRFRFEAAGAALRLKARPEPPSTGARLPEGVGRAIHGPLPSWRALAFAEGRDMPAAIRSPPLPRSRPRRLRCESRWQRARPHQAIRAPCGPRRRRARSPCGSKRPPSSAPRRRRRAG